MEKRIEGPPMRGSKKKKDKRPEWTVTAKGRRTWEKKLGNSQHGVKKGKSVPKKQRLDAKIAQTRKINGE